MKRVIALLMVFAFLHTPAVAEATHKRGVTEFCELYMYRLMMLQHEYDLDYNVRILESYSSPLKLPDDTIQMNSTAGTMNVNTVDYTVNSVTMTFINLNATDEANEQHAMSCMMALSALEFNEMDELKLNVNSKLNGGSETAIDEALSIFNDELSGVIEDAIQKSIETGEQIQVYSGNYDYYIAYDSGKTDDREYEYIFLLSRAHE